MSSQITECSHIEQRSEKGNTLRVTIKSIAKDLGISHMTVSRALSGSLYVNEQKRAEILAHAHKLGYVKSSAAATIRGQSSAIVGLLLPNVINEFYANFANTLAILCADQELDLMIHLTNDEAEREYKSILRLRSLQAKAVIMVPTPNISSKLPELLKDIDVINLIRTRDQTTRVDELLINDATSIKSAVDHLVKLGHKKIAYIGATDALSSGKERLSAFLSAKKDFKTDTTRLIVKQGSPGYKMGFDCIETLLNEEDKIDALICGGFEISNGALEACMRRGLKFPMDLAFVGYGDPSVYQWIAGGITTIAVSAEKIAQQAIMLLTRSGTPDILVRHRSPTHLIIRHSTQIPL